MDLVQLLIVSGIVAAVFGLVIAGMAIGVILSNRRIKGSCGGLATMRDGNGESPCMACGASELCDEATKTVCDGPVLTGER